MSDDRAPLGIVQQFMPNAASATVDGPHYRCDDGSTWSPVEPGGRANGLKVGWEIYPTTGGQAMNSRGNHD